MITFKDLRPFIISIIIFSMSFMFGLIALIIDITTTITIIHPFIALIIIIGSIGLLNTVILGLKDVFNTINRKEVK